MAVNIEEIGIYRPRNAAATVETAASSGILAANIKKPIIYEDSIQR